MSGVYIKGLNIEPSDDGFDGKGLVIIGYDDKLYAVAHEQIIPLPDHGDLIDRDKLKHGFCVECTLYPDNCLGENCDWGSIYHIEHAPAVIPAERSEE